MKVAAAVVRDVVPLPVVAQHLGPGGQAAYLPEMRSILRVKFAQDVELARLRGGRVAAPNVELRGERGAAEAVLRAQNPGTDEEAQVAVHLDPGEGPVPGSPVARGVTVGVAADPFIVVPGVDRQPAVAFTGRVPLVVVEMDAAAPGGVDEAVVPRAAHHPDPDLRFGGTPHGDLVVRAPEHETDLAGLPVVKSPAEVRLVRIKRADRNVYVVLVDPADLRHLGGIGG